MAEQLLADGSEAHPGERGAEYVVIARRYRPQTFTDLIGQEHVAKGLAAAIAASRVGHAYLFTGARGTGKTSTARILAKALNCQEGPTPTPCNKCDICQSITAGDDMDVLEIDGASNRGIDEIRQLRQNVNVRPSRARFKIYIIDEVHMLTEPAFNALLKTLEEPPEHVKFIFCTTEPEKIPITILSRCQRFDFAGIQTKQIVERLAQIAAGEGVAAETEALEVLARRAAGSMRDSQSLLEQLLAFGSKQITVSDVHGLLGTAGSERIQRLVGHLINRDPAAALAELDRGIGEGVDVGQLLEQLLGHFRDVLAATVGCPPDSMIYVTVNEQQAAQEAAKHLGPDTTMAILQILDQALGRLKFVTYPRVIAELALVRICRLDELESLPELISQLNAGGAGAGSGGATSAGVAAKKKFELTPEAVSAQAPTSRIQAPTPTPIQRSATEANGQADHSKNGTSAASPMRSQSSAVDLDQVNSALAEVDDESPGVPSVVEQGDELSLWKSVATQLGGLAAEMALQVERVVRPSDRQLVAFFPAKYNSCKRFCERADVFGKLRQLIAEALGQEVNLKFEVVEEKGKDQDQAASRPTNMRQRMFQISQRPYVRQVMEMFDATVERVDSPN